MKMSTWKSQHKLHKVLANKSAAQQAKCAAKRKSLTCAEARKATDPDKNDRDTCYLTPDNLWKFEDLPGYFSCLQACCEDYDSNLMLNPITCKDIFGFYPSSQEEVCAGPLEVQNPPEGTKVQDVCPDSCGLCTGPATAQTTTTTPKPPITLTAQPVQLGEPVQQPDIDSSIKAMCRAKLSRFTGINLTPDPSGKSKFALKELTKANRCFD